MSQLTERQQEILDFIRDYSRDHGWAPTIREIGDRFGLNSTNGVACHLEALEKKGYIVRGANQSRAIRVIQQDAVGNEPT